MSENATLEEMCLAKLKNSDFLKERTSSEIYELLTSNLAQSNSDVVKIIVDYVKTDDFLDKIPFQSLRLFHDLARTYKL